MSFEVKTLTKVEKPSTEIDCGGGSGCSSAAGSTTGEEGRGLRVRKRMSEPLCCPICSCTVRPTEIDQHFALEVERLDKLSHSQRSRRLSGHNNHHNNSCLAGTSSSASSSQNAHSSHQEGSSSSSSTSSTPAGGSSASSSDTAWGTYQKIKSNRQTRLKLKSKKRKLEHQCPICDKAIPSSEDINIHVEMCLKKTRNSTGSNSSDDDSIDIDGEYFEEYEFAGETRIRATSLVEGGLSAAGLGTVVSRENPDDEDEDLNVDGDDTQIYGPSQYSEKDVIPPPSSLLAQEENGEYLRRLVIGTTSSSSPEPTRENHTPPADTLSSSFSTDKPEKNHPQGGKSHEITLEALKQKILEYESGSRNKCKCLICLDEFKVPVVSISCWHVHCEECWFRTLGARKLCPQCNMITSPSDLRRIYL